LGKSHWARTFELFGGDPLPYGLGPNNRFVIERLAAYLAQQGFIPSVPDIDEPVRRSESYSPLIPAF
jgi:hypothetical protein